MSELIPKPGYYDKWRTQLRWNEINELRQQRFSEKILNQPVFAELLALINKTEWPQARSCDWRGPAVRIGERSELSPEQFAEIEKLLRAFCPWKKGPFSIFGHEIDSEWRSDLKWERIAKVIPSLQDKNVADIGCSNGYFMLRMLEHKPAHIVGMDPYAKAFLNFELLKKFTNVQNIDFELLGAEHAEYYPECFDVVFCLGVIYHHTDPMLLLRSIYQSMSKGATLIIESQGIPGELPVALTPKQRYAQARGIWFLPTQACLQNWLSRAQFRDIECFYNEPLSTEEQRRTDWADVDSLSDFLDQDDPQKTIEGYPAPVRIYCKARK